MRVQTDSRNIANLISSALPVEPVVVKKRRKATLSWGRTLRLASLCLVAYWLVIFVGTHLPSSSIPRLGGSDKLLHFGAFGGLAFLVAWALPTREGKALQRALWTLGLVITYGMLDELTQKLIPGRTCSMGDFIADAIGACMGLAAYFVAKAVLVRTQLGQGLINRLSVSFRAK
jgi:VanZ family protein